MPESARVARVHPLALRAWPFLPEAAPAATWWVGPLGELVQVLEDGTAEPLEGFRTLAEDPCAGRRAVGAEGPGVSVIGPSAARRPGTARRAAP